jgi:hypothetical protein
MSPQQMQAGVSKVVTNVDTNLWTSLLLSGYDVVTGQYTQDEKLTIGGQIYDGMSKALSAPAKRLFKTTRPGINDQTYDKAYEVLKQQGDKSWEEKIEVKKTVSDLMSGKGEGRMITGTNAEINKYKRAAQNMKIDGEIKMIRQMGVENNIRGAYIAERYYELSKGPTADPEKLEEFQNQLTTANLISEKVQAQIMHYTMVLKIEQDIIDMRKEGKSEDEIKKTLKIPHIWPKAYEYPYDRSKTK